MVPRMTMTTMFPFFLLLVLSLTSHGVQGTTTTISANPSSASSTKDTGTDEKVFLGGPFESGCLYNRKKDWMKKRVCNSEDDPRAIEKGICRKPAIQYDEIRLFAPNWESGFLQSWMLQILLSEILDIPTTLETGTPDAYVNFYDPMERVEYGASYYDTISLENAHYETNNGDCTTVKTIAGGGRDYVPCSHYLPEIWHGANDFSQEQARQGIIEPQEGTGLLGYEGWFVPKFTGVQDPSLLNYLGLMGEGNRRKLAETFLRPTTWSDYCQQVSSNNCQTPDNVARHPPRKADEMGRFFVDGIYTGHYRKTPKNDCDLFPTNCTGHIADFPCDWTSFTIGQLHHLNIALEGDGTETNVHSYSYSQLIELWLAANATKSNLLMMWWSPELLYQQFQNTDAEFIAIGMPPPSQECFNHRITPEERCSDDFETRIGDPKGVCGEAARPLTKKIATILKERTYDSSIPIAIQSPGYDVLDDFTLTNTQLDEIFQKWFSEPSPRHALCDWVVENMEHMERFIPEGHPRTLQKDNKNTALIYAATILGAITMILVIMTAYGVHRYREKQCMKFAQVEFLFLLLTGSVLISIGAIVLGAPSTDVTCIMTVWLVNIGYTLELVPLLIKISAINRLISAAQKMRRLRLNRNSLFGGVIGITFFVVIFLILWTTIDPPRIKQDYVLTDQENDNGETIISNGEYCSSESPIWSYTAVGWNTLLLLMATVLAFQARRLSSPYNESGTLAILIYSHFVFVLLRIVTFFLASNVRASVLESARSILFSADTMATILIYFLPKFTFKEGAEGAEQCAMNNIGSGLFRLSPGSLRNHNLTNTEYSNRNWMLPKIISNITMVSRWNKVEGDTKNEGLSKQESSEEDGGGGGGGGGDDNDGDNAGIVSGNSPEGETKDITESSRQQTLREAGTDREQPRQNDNQNQQNDDLNTAKLIDAAIGDEASAISFKTAISPDIVSVDESTSISGSSRQMQLTQQQQQQQQLQQRQLDHGRAVPVMPGESEIELHATIDEQNATIDELKGELAELRRLLAKETSIVEA